MGKKTLANPRKGKTKNKKQRAAAEAAEGAAILAAGARKRKRDEEAAAGLRTHVPEALGAGGARTKINTEELSPNSKKKVEKRRGYVAKRRLKKLGKAAVAEVSAEVLANPTLAWATKPSGKVNKNPDRARQRAAADLAAALPKNSALHGPAVAAFMQHPVGKRAHAALEIAPPTAPKTAKRLDALEAMASDVGEGLALMRASAAVAKEGARVHQEKPAPQPRQRSARSRSVPATSGQKKRGHGGRSLSVDHRDAASALFTLAAGQSMTEGAQGPGRASDGRQLEVADAMGVARQTAYHWFKRGAENRAAAIAGEGEWARAPTRLTTHAISAENAALAAEFITKHASVTWSPLTSDTILVPNLAGERVPTRVAHTQDGLTPIYRDWEEAHPGVMHERRFRDCCPKNIKPMTKRKRQFCACKYHMSMRMRHARVKQLRAQIKTEQLRQRSARQSKVERARARPMDAPLEHETLQDALDSVTCDPPAGFQFVRAACAHNQCADCPKLKRPRCSVRRT